MITVRYFPEGDWNFYLFPFLEVAVVVENVVGND